MSWHIKSKKSILFGMLFFTFFDVFSMRGGHTLSHSHIKVGRDKLYPLFLYSNNNLIDVSYEDMNHGFSFVFLHWVDGDDIFTRQAGFLSNNCDLLEAKQNDTNCSVIESFYDSHENVFYFLPTAHVQKMMLNDSGYCEYPGRLDSMSTTHNSLRRDANGLSGDEKESLSDDPPEYVGGKRKL